MVPIRVGLVCFSTSTSSVGLGAWAWSAHLSYLLWSPKYRVVALCDISKQVAKASILRNKLDINVEAYSSPMYLVKDPNVDLVVISISMIEQYETARLAILAGKDVFAEWPVAFTLGRMSELSCLAKARDVRTVVGLQTRADPLLLKLKEIIDGGRIGKVMSSTVLGLFTVPIDACPQNMAYFVNQESGSNTFTVNFGHFLDSFIHILGDFSQLKSVIRAQYPTIEIFNAVGKTIVHDHHKTAPDHALVQGILESGAIASLNFRTVISAVDGAGIRWLISGTEGEIEITTPEMLWQFRQPGWTFKLKLGTGAVNDVEFDLPNENYPGSFLHINTARLYEAFANKEKDKYADLEDCLGTYRTLQKILQASK